MGQSYLKLQLEVHILSSIFGKAPLDFLNEALDSVLPKKTVTHPFFN